MDKSKSNKVFTTIKDIPMFFKRNFVLFILAIADVAIFAIPFYMDNYIPNMNANFKLAQADYSQAGAVYGYVAMPCYILGAWFGDKFRAKSLVVAGVVITGLLAVWYVVLPFIPMMTGNGSVKTLIGTARDIMLTQLCIIFAGFAFATTALFWAPLWKLVKNVNTEGLPAELQEKQVGKNNGIQGMINVLTGLLIALFGTLLFFLQKNSFLGKIGGENGVAVAFLILISIYAGIILTSAALAIFFIKEPKVKEPLSFSVKALVNVLKQKTIILLSLLVLGVYMLQMGLSSYVNYLSNVFWIPAIVVMIIGIFRTYAMRFLISGWFGKWADTRKSYIPLICGGLFIGMILISVGILLPAFSGDNINDPSKLNRNSASVIILQIAAAFNLILMGAVTWAVVTIRWSPIGTDLKVQNDNYVAAVNIVSVIAFTPDAFFKQIRSAIEAKHHMWIKKDDADNIIEFIITPTKGQNLSSYTQVANTYGNQLILAVVLGFAALGLLSGIILHFILQHQNRLANIESRLQVLEEKLAK